MQELRGDALHDLRSDLAMFHPNLDLFIIFWALEARPRAAPARRNASPSPQKQATYRAKGASSLGEVGRFRLHMELRLCDLGHEAALIRESTGGQEQQPYGSHGPQMELSPKA